MACRGSFWCELNHGQGPKQVLCIRSGAQLGFLLLCMTDPILAGIGSELVPLFVLSCNYHGFSGDAFNDVGS